jgi:hypothetical protein
VPGIFPGFKGGQYVALTTLPPSCAECLEIVESQPPGTLGACSGTCRDCFTCISFIHILTECTEGNEVCKYNPVTLIGFKHVIPEDGTVMAKHVEVK